MANYAITQDADTDLEIIARSTIETWGLEQAERYLDSLHQCFQNIGDRRVQGRAFSELFPHVFVTHCQHHYIFYLTPDNQKPVIFAVLHERMDLLVRLKERLS